MSDGVIETATITLEGGGSETWDIIPGTGMMLSGGKYEAYPMWTLICGERSRSAMINDVINDDPGLRTRVLLWMLYGFRDNLDVGHTKLFIWGRASNGGGETAEGLWLMLFDLEGKLGAVLPEPEWIQGGGNE